VRQVVAILNPRSDRGRTAQLAERLLAATRGKLDMQLLHTTDRGDAVRRAREAAAAGAETVVAVGGDGTVHEVANGLMAIELSARPRLGIVPAGSGNDVAYALGISKNLDENIATISGANCAALDVALVTASSGRSCYATNNVGTLLEGLVNLRSHELNWPRGSGLYVRAFLETMLSRLPVSRLQLDVDGRTMSRTACALSMGNGPRSGGKFLLYPDASNGDGEFDFLLAPPLGRRKLLWELYQSTRGANASGPIERGRFRRLTMQSDVPLAVHVDGEPWLRPDEGAKELKVEVVPSALRVLCP
jgi:YegS/Rv2252/BmrU family lipid kinase